MYMVDNVLHMCIKFFQLLLFINIEIMVFNYRLRRWRKLSMILNGLEQASRSLYNLLPLVLPSEVMDMEICRYTLFLNLLGSKHLKTTIGVISVV